MIICESKMNFIIPDKASVFQIEESKIMKNLGTGLKRVEFILLDQKGTLIFLEAKPAGYIYSEKAYLYDKRIKELVEKFENSIDVFFAIQGKRIRDSRQEVGEKLMNAEFYQKNIRCYVVINGSKEEFCKTVTLRLQHELKRRLQIYNMNIFAINKKQALEIQLIENADIPQNTHTPVS